jgi:hypothetical protein
MPTNRANREVCDVDIRSLDKKPVLFFETANTTTQEFNADAVYAMAKGSKRIAFANPIEGTASIEAQVYPFELYALMAGGTIETSAAYPVKKIIKADTAGSITIPDTNVLEGSVFVFASGEWGGTEIDGSFATGKFTATATENIAKDKEYEVGYIVTKTSGVKKISINNKNLPKAYYITMNTVEKTEDDEVIPFKIILYKAQPQRNFSLSQSSEGDPATITMTFDLLEDKNGNVSDFVEVEDED